jgi:hypothetical protein
MATRHNGMKILWFMVVGFWSIVWYFLLPSEYINDALAQIGQASPRQMTIGQPAASEQLIDPCGPHGIDCSTKTVPGNDESLKWNEKNLLHPFTAPLPMKGYFPKEIEIHAGDALRLLK